MSLLGAGGVMLAAALYLWTLIPPFGGLIAIVPLALVFLPWFPLGTMRVPPSTVLGYLAHDFRLAARLVSVGQDEITVRLGWWAAVKIRARPDHEGSTVAYQVYATPGAWATLIFMFFITWPAPFTIIPVLYIFHRVVTSVEARIAPLVREGRLPEAFRPDDVRVLLIATLGEAQRLAREGYESERDAYQDAQGIVVLAEILGWLVLFVGLSLVLTDPDESQRLWNAVLVATASMLGLGVLMAVLVRRRFLPAIRRVREWTSRLEGALRAEAAHEPTPREPTSTLDLLLQASREVPEWIAAKRRAGLSQDWGMWILLFVLAWWSIELIISSVWFLMLQSTLGVILLAAGIGLAVAAERLYRRWHRKREEELAQLQEGWRRQFHGLREGMERFLQEL